jgi:hypothetical protein
MGGKGWLICGEMQCNAEMLGWDAVPIDGWSVKRGGRKMRRREEKRRVDKGRVGQAAAWLSVGNC